MHHRVGFRRAVAADDIERSRVPHAVLQHVRDVDQMRIDRMDLIVMVVAQQHIDRVQRARHIDAVMDVFRPELLAGMEIDEGEFAAGPCCENPGEGGYRRGHRSDQTQAGP